MLLLTLRRISSILLLLFATSAGGQETPPPPPTPVYGPSGASAAQQSRIDAAIAAGTAGRGATVEANIMGNDNDIHITQAGSPSYLNLMILGNTNTFDAYGRGRTRI